jgi:HSP20 family protein
MNEDEDIQKIDIIEEPSEAHQEEEQEHEDWFELEGELAIDVYETDKDIVIQSAIAGVRSEELDISLENDVVTIKGVRKNPNQEEEKQYFHEECFWGPFSRQVFLPEEVDTKNVEASIKEGVLTLRLPKAERQKTRKVKIARD